MRLLITGGSAFIGRNLAEDLSQRHQVHAPGRRELDLLDEGAVERFLSSQRYDVVVHCANEARDPQRTVPHNCRMFFNLVRCERSFGKLISLGSGAEFDRRAWKLGMSEDDFGRHVPADDYGFSKYVIARYIERLERSLNLRLFGVFGRHEEWTRRFISNACCRAAWDLPITIRRNAVFDYLWVGDLSRILEWFIEHDPPENTYNVCTGQTYELKALAAKVLAVAGKSLPIEVTDPAAGDQYGGDNHRLLHTLSGFKFRPIDESIADLYQWYSRNRELFPREPLLAQQPTVRSH